jgi:hypothetical protein
LEKSGAKNFLTWFWGAGANAVIARPQSGRGNPSSSAVKQRWIASLRSQ